MISSERLSLIPLTASQLQKYVLNDGSLEVELQLEPTNRIISDDLKEALSTTIIPNVANENANYLFSTLWSVVSNAESKIVGDLCFFGAPKENGEIEIGYGTYEDFRGNGYMKDAVALLINWAKSQSKILTIIASTDKSNIASYSILEKNDFIKVSENDTLYNWKLTL
ncbi:N-acetyltransferase [Flavobacterium amnicola]|uniref:N-acetyltransferase n=1 Tax=Flavobacterium amnicola TaxID=2506422 RepID=A0A4Q1K1L1_9FLAO|nr:GNAT family N-acetyltransferase [Flavobacterium amnicola]RXR16284.1 N-acetyltransferase [Flavobacterium amnicola]